MTAELIRRDEEAVRRDPQKRRDMIKTILIIFLAAMLLLTFFSNTIMNRSLAEISGERSKSGKLTERVRGSGLVEANQSYNVTVDGNRIVDGINIRAGQTVAEGDVLFTVGTGESAELTEAQRTLASLELEYQKMLITAPADYSAENKAIENARTDYNTAVAKRDIAAANEKSAQAAQTQYNKDKLALASKTQEEAELTAAVSGLDMDDFSMIPVEYTGSLISLYNTYTTAEAQYNEAYGIYSSLLEKGSDTSAAKEEADAKKTAMDTAFAAYDAEKSAVRAVLVSECETVRGDIESLTAAVGVYESGLSEGGLSLADLETEVTAKKRALEDLEIALEKLKKENSYSAELTSLDTEAKMAEIETQRERVEKLKKTCETTEIISEYSGVVSAVNVQPGELTIPDMPLASIDIADAGYVVKVTVEGEISQKVSTGTQADVVNNWSGNVQAVLRTITNDTTENSDNRILVFDVTGDVDSGTYVDLSIPCGSGEYDVIVPKSAVYEDANGKFVLTIKSKSSPLGNRYYAERVNVEVLVSDETSSAVQGELMQGEHVITASSKPVAPGDQVRMKD
ncbi:MAG: RND transporter [Ruminococcus sp.]|nr:RND transporter [Ruminococcus sp.]